jgi:hypothetical protein
MMPSGFHERGFSTAALVIKAYNTTAAPFVWTKSEVYQKRLKPRFAKQ